MSQPWSPEIVVTESLARKLIEGQFPQLAPVSLVLLGQGFDNSVYSINDQFTFRFPRRSMAVELLRTESQLLPALVPKLPLAIPEPLFLGVPSDVYPWPFTGSRLVQGETPGQLSHAQRMRAVEPLAMFLNTLHRFPIATARDLGVPNDRMGRIDLVKRRPMLFSNAEKLIQCGYVQDGQAIQDFLSSFVCEGLDQRDTLVHGDLHFKNLIVDKQGTLTGVIDWGDTHVGHPAVDLSIVYGLLPPEGRRQFYAIYGDVDAQTKSVARFKGIYTLSALILYAHDHGDMALVTAARESLTLALADG